MKVYVEQRRRAKLTAHYNCPSLAKAMRRVAMRHVLGVALYADELAAHEGARNARRAAAHERIEDEVTGFRVKLETPLDDLERFLRGVSDRRLLGVQS